MVEIDSFVGREAETERVIGLLDSGARLVTLTGPAGHGKSRLAKHVAAGQELFDQWAVVDLAAVDDLDLVAGHIAQSIGGGQQVTTGVAGWPQLAQLLCELRFLLVLDNCEHLLDASDDQEGLDELVGLLLRSAPQLTCLATSRMALQVRGEHPLPLEPLHAPDPAEQPEAALTSEALQLFIDRSRAADATIDLAEAGNRRAAARLVHRLGGIPMLVEQVAARVGTRSSVTELETRFTADSYRKLLSQVMAWTWEACSPDQQRLLARLTVFRGGWSLPAAEAVAGSELDEIDELLNELRRSGLVIRAPGVVPTRYRMLQAVREWVQHRLDPSELDDARSRHQRWCAQIIDDAATQGHGPAGSGLLCTLRGELDNVRAALTRCTTPNDARWGLPVAVTLANARVPFIQGELSEWGRHHLSRLRQLYPHRDATWVAALATEAWVGVCQGDPDTETLLSQAQQAADQLGEPDHWLVLYARAVSATFGQGPEHEAGVLWEQALTALREESPPETHVFLGLVGMWQAVHAGGFAEPSEAERIINAYRTECRTHDSDHLLSWGDWAWALLCVRRGDLSEAVIALRASITTQQHHHDLWGLPWSLVIALLVTADSQQWRDTARLLGAVDLVMLRTEIAFRRLRGLGEAVASAERRARAALPAKDYDYAYSRGHALSFDDACDLPLTLPLFRDPHMATPLVTPVLTVRQQQVAALLLQGATNRAIAEHLGVSHATVDSHVHQILQRTGATSRRDTRTIATHLHLSTE
ncbi:LuxR C-terminal-related transcriptional regulator [Saccharopolyspora sp. ID03-671]|uniref:ATP-binding protein n=1 Tax=Saccharopolyspora sp. ID03-671 TaxID=3073066 RepID=UPI003247E618